MGQNASSGEARRFRNPGACSLTHEKCTSEEVHTSHLPFCCILIWTLGRRLKFCSVKLVRENEETMSIFTVLFVVLLIAWILGWGVFHVAGGLIHLLIVLAVISLIVHFVRGTARAV